MATFLLTWWKFSGGNVSCRKGTASGGLLIWFSAYQMSLNRREPHTLVGTVPTFSAELIGSAGRLSGFIHDSRKHWPTTT
jgi:hypothetical protein